MGGDKSQAKGRGMGDTAVGRAASEWGCWFCVKVGTYH